MKNQIFSLLLSAVVFTNHPLFAMEPDDEQALKAEYPATFNKPFNMPAGMEEKPKEERIAYIQHSIKIDSLKQEYCQKTGDDELTQKTAALLAREKHMKESNLAIITCDKHEAACLRVPSPPLTDDNWELAIQTAEKLLYMRNEVLKGGAGLAAPQIGINVPVFIYTPDRKPENLRVVISPSFEPIGTDKAIGYEACFSVPLKCTKIPRWKIIRVSYQDINSQIVKEDLEGFASKVFQHEMDHIRGSLTIDHEAAEIITFEDEQSFQEYMSNVVKEDEKIYTR